MTIAMRKGIVHANGCMKLRYGGSTNWIPGMESRRFQWFQRGDAMRYTGEGLEEYTMKLEVPST